MKHLRKLGILLPVAFFAAIMCTEAAMAYTYPDSSGWPPKVKDLGAGLYVCYVIAVVFIIPGLGMAFSKKPQPTRVVVVSGVLMILVGAVFSIFGFFQFPLSTWPTQRREVLHDPLVIPAAIALLAAGMFLLIKKVR